MCGEEEIIQPKPFEITPLVLRQVEEEEEVLRTKEVAGHTPEVTPNLESRMRGSGQPLPNSVHAFLEPRFGQDLSEVRVHTDSNAVQMNRELNAQAFTYGRDIYFGAGRYNPGASSGKKLLAHELTHVVQQNQSQYIPIVQRRGPPVPRPSPVPTVDCTPSNIAEITAALPIARAMVRKAIRVIGVSSSPAISILLMKYFNDASASTLLHTLIGYRNLLTGITGSFTIECEQPGSFMYSYFCGGIYGYVRAVPWANVHICAGAFGRSAVDLAETIVHESSHKFDNTDDEAYCWGGCPASMSRWDAYDNADSFSKFAWEAYTTLP